MATRKYQVYKKQVSYDGGDTWEDVLPVETMKMPVYGETCSVPYAARTKSSIWYSYKPEGFERRLPPMSILTKEAVAYLTSGSKYPGEAGGSICPGLYIGTGVTEIAASAFTDFSGEGETVHFEEPSSVQTIKSRAFFDHSYREIIKIPDSVETIESQAFATSGSTKLKYIEIGTGCTYIGSNAFSDINWSRPGTDKGRVFVMKGSTPPELDGENPFSRNYQGGGYTIIVPGNALSSYRSAWVSISGNVITDTALGNSAKAETNMCRVDGNNWYPSVQQFPNDGSTTLTFSDLTGGTTCWVISWLKIGDSVKSIPDNAFDAYSINTSLTYLNLGNGLETIGSGAFRSQEYITNLEIPDSVTSIGSGAFIYCNSLKTLKIGSGCTTIGRDAFRSCSGLISLVMGDNVEYIGDNAFGCLSLRLGDNFKLPKSLRYLGASAFSLLNPVTMKSLEIPSGVETIGRNALQSFSPDILQICGNPSEIGSGACSQRVAVAIAATTPPTVMVTSDETHGSIIDNINKIGWMKTSLIYVPDDVIDTYKTTYGWDFLRQHIFPLSEIDDILDFADGYKFCGLYDKEGSMLPPQYYNKEQGLFKYGEYDGSTTLTSGETTWSTSYTTRIPDILWVGDNVEYIDKNVGIGSGTLSGTRVVIFGTGLRSFNFVGHQNTGAIYVFKTSTPPDFSCNNYETDYYNGRVVTNSIFYVPDNAVETYRNWLKEAAVITYRKGQSGEGCTNGEYIPTSDFNVRPLSDFCKLSDNLKKRWVEIPGQYGCSGTTKMSMEKEQATTDWINWTDTGRTRIGKRVIEPFSDDCGYVSYTGKFRGTMGDGTIVELPCDGSSALTKNELSAITSANTLEYVEIGDCTSTIGGDVLGNSRKVKVVRISDDVTTISNEAFRYCSGMTTCTIGDGVTSIGDAAFYRCSGMTTCTIGSSVTSIGVFAFSECTVLTSVTIPASVTNIGMQVFYESSGLTSVTVEATTPPTLGAAAFGQTNDCPIYVPAASVETYKAASGWSTYASRIQAIT